MWGWREDYDEQRLEQEQGGEGPASDRCRCERGLAGVRVPVRLLLDALEHPGNAAEEYEVDRQEDKSAPTAHPAAQLLDADRADAGQRPSEPVADGR